MKAWLVGVGGARLGSPSAGVNGADPGHQDRTLAHRVGTPQGGATSKPLPTSNENPPRQCWFRRRMPTLRAKPDTVGVRGTQGQSVASQ